MYRGLKKKKKKGRQQDFGISLSIGHPLPLSYYTGTGIPLS